MVPVSQFEYVRTKWYTRCSRVRPASVIPSSVMCVKSDAHSRPGVCFWPKYTSCAGPSVTRHSLMRRCSVRICPSLNRPGYSRCSHSNSVLASRPGLSSTCRLAGTLRGVAIEQSALVERLSAGTHEITRTIKLTSRAGWVHVETRMEPRGRVELHSVADTFRFEGRPDWSYSPSIGGFNPDAQYKAPLILTQERQRAFGIVPDLAVLNRESIQ